MGSRAAAAVGRWVAVLVVVAGCGGDGSTEPFVLTAQQVLLLDDADGAFELLDDDAYHRFNRSRLRWQREGAPGAVGGSLLRAGCGASETPPSVALWSFTLQLPLSGGTVEVAVPREARTRAQVIFCALWGSDATRVTACQLIDQSRWGWVAIARGELAGEIKVVVDPLVCDGGGDLDPTMVVDAVRVRGG